MRFFKFIFISLFGKEMEVCVEVKNFKIMSDFGGPILKT